MKLIALAIIFSLAVYCRGELTVKDGKVKITVYTDANCGDTINFFNNQLSRTYEKYSQHLELDFVPWGRTRVVDQGLQCLHGVRGCWANRVHRCGLHLLGDDHVAKTKFMTCEFVPSSPSNAFQGSYYCADLVGIQLEDLDVCVSSNQYDYLDSAAQAASQEALEVINFVPSIVFNDEVDLELHRSALIRLEVMICFALAADPSTGVTSCQI